MLPRLVWDSSPSPAPLPVSVFSAPYLWFAVLSEAVLEMKSRPEGRRRSREGPEREDEEG